VSPGERGGDLFGRATRLLRPGERFTLAVDPPEVRRGETVRITLSIRDPGRVRGDALEVGLRCTERYAYREPGPGGRGGRRRTASATVVEQWDAADPGVTLQVRQLVVPEWAPFSHDGRVLAFAWTVLARERRAGFDQLVQMPVRVRP